MERINGFLDLDSYFKKDYQELIKLGILKYDNSFEQYFDEHGKKSNHWITINNEKYYLKRSNYWEQELVVEEFFKLLGLDNLHYDVAILDGVEYVISKDYKKVGNTYISGRELLEDFYLKIKNSDKRYFKDNFNIRLNARKEVVGSLLNNLENIWQAIALKYQNYSNKDEIVYKLVDELKTRFLIREILLMDSDYHCNNWVIEESDEIKLVPNFDNESTLMTDIYGLPFGINNESINDSAYDQLKYYLEVSDSNNVIEFINLFNKANPALLNLAIEKVEQERKITISNKNELMENYSKNYEHLETIVNRYRGKHGR